MISSIGSREDALDLADWYVNIAKGLKRRPEPLEDDASKLAEIGREISFAAVLEGDWPNGVLSRGQVQGWAHRTSAVEHHIKSVVGDELEMTCSELRRAAARLQDHAQGLRPTGEWRTVAEQVPKSGEINYDPADSEDPDELAETQKMTFKREKE
jgi:hypothetical protein